MRDVALVTESTCVCAGSSYQVFSIHAHISQTAWRPFRITLQRRSASGDRRRMRMCVAPPLAHYLQPQVATPPRLLSAPQQDALSEGAQHVVCSAVEQHASACSRLHRPWPTRTGISVARGASLTNCNSRGAPEIEAR